MTPPQTGRDALRQAAEPGYARLYVPDANPALAILTELGDEPPIATQGGGGWEGVAIPGAEALTVWRGFDALGYDLPLRLDAFPEGGDVQDAVQVLEAMWGRGRQRMATGGGRPPAVIVDTAGAIPDDATAFPAQLWIVTNLAWDVGDAITVSAPGATAAGPRALDQWARIDVTVSLLKYNPDQPLVDAAMKVRQTNRTRNAARRGARYTTKAGDTLISIARARLHDAGRWRELATLNPAHRDPRAKMAAGIHLRLP